MFPRATCAWCGSTSSEMMAPPLGSPAAIAMAEYPVKVPISRIRVAWVAKTSSSRKRPSWRPTIIPQPAKSSRVESSTDSRCPGGAVVCASAYSRTSGLTSCAMTTMVRAGAGPGRIDRGRGRSVPDLRAETEQPLQVVDVGVVEGHGHEHVRCAAQLGLLLCLAARHHAEVEEALRHLAHDAGGHGRVVGQAFGEVGGVACHRLSQLVRLGVAQV